MPMNLTQKKNAHITMIPKQSLVNMQNLLTKHVKTHTHTLSLTHRHTHILDKIHALTDVTVHRWGENK